MATPAQIQANRANAQRSTGPRTPEGKDAARYNALAHGLRARAILLPGEDPAEFQSFRDRMIRDMDVQGDYEKFLAERVVQDAWRIHRGLAVEAQLFQSDLDRPAGDGDDSACALSDAGIKRLDLFARYQAHLERSFNRNARLLRAVQADRINQSRRKERDDKVSDIRSPAPAPAAATSPAQAPGDPGRQVAQAKQPEAPVNPGVPGEELASFGKNNSAAPRQDNPSRGSAPWPQRTTAQWKARPSRRSA